MVKLLLTVNSTVNSKAFDSTNPIYIFARFCYTSFGNSKNVVTNSFVAVNSSPVAATSSLVAATSSLVAASSSLVAVNSSYVVVNSSYVAVNSINCHLLLPSLIIIYYIILY